MKILLIKFYHQNSRKWLYVIIMSRTSFRVDLNSIVSLNVKQILARSRRHIWSLSDSNGIRTHNHLFRKQTLNHLAKPAKWLSCVVSTYLHSAFDCMLLSSHVWDKHRADMYSQHSSIIWPVWLNGWVFIYELNGCGFESRCCHLEKDIQHNMHV